MRRGILAAATLLAAAACSSRPVPERPVEAREVCAANLEVPPAFHRIASVEIPQTSWVAVRESFRDERGREIHVVAGLAGEFGEGMPVAGTVQLAGGGEARLIGERSSWLAVWDTGGPCGPRMVGGVGFFRGTFLHLLGEMGVT